MSTSIKRVTYVVELAQFTLGFHYNQQIKSFITTNVCELSFALPETWIRFGLPLIVGAGPAGLATSVYAASEGLSVLVLDCRSFGGQGRRVGAHRELSRFSDRHQRHGADGTRL